MWMPSGRGAACLAAALSVVATPLLQAGQQDRPVFRSKTRLIEVSVVVTNRDRNPAPGLTADDFQIFDDGKPQKVELFSIGAATAAAAAPAPAERPAREFSNDIADIGSVTIILYDQLNMSDDVRMNARQHVVRFLEQIRPHDRVGLYVLDGNGVLRVVHDFTSDASALVRALSSLRGSTSLALAGQEDAARLEAQLAGLLTEDGLVENGTRAMLQHYQGNRSVDTIDALESIGHHLSGVQNRKNLIWVSSGFPLQAFNYRGRSATNEINRATRSLNDANVALYTVDARGLIAAFATAGRLTVPTLSMVQTNQDILQIASEQTGGRAFLNTNDIQGAIRRTADDARMTYLLGYYPTDDRWDGRYHRIVVKMNRPGFELRHREGYFAVATEKQASSERADALNAAVVSPINASALGLTLRIDPVQGRSSEYRLTLRVQPGAIALERRGDESRGAIDVIVAQVRADGAEGRSLEKRVDISFSDERLPHFLREGMSIDHTFTLVPSAARLRVVVRDVRTGAIGAIGVSRQQLQAIVP
jgi:VWFA-related protein